MKTYVVWIRRPGTDKIDTYRQEGNDISFAIAAAQAEYYSNNRQHVYARDIVLACEKDAI